MTIPEKAAQWAVNIANDDSHGYDQAHRYGPDYDCSSLVISAYKAAGLPLAATYTGDMRNDFFKNGFTVPQNVNLANGTGLCAGDVLLNEQHHAAIYVGNGNIVNAGSNEFGGTTGGQTGDQTSKEIRVMPYYNFPWDYCLRYSKQENSAEMPAPDKYTVKPGDSLWSIAARFLGAGERYAQIMAANNLTDSLIYPGQILIIPSDNVGYRTIKVTIRSDTYEILEIMAKGWDKTMGQVIDALMEDAV